MDIEDATTAVATLGSIGRDINLSYHTFIAGKTHEGAMCGFDPEFVPKMLHPFQEYLCDWSIRKGRGALFADCGLGKTAIQLTWAYNVARHTGKPVLILTPLAVGSQTIREGEKFGIECRKSNDGAIKGQIIVSNYEKLHLFHPSDFSGVVLDESSILKSFDGATRIAITTFLRKIQYRLLATATAAPNDYIELGSSSEALGYMGYMDMLNRFFKNDQNNSALKRMYGESPKWRFKGHAEVPFWRWVASWALACRKPSDIGFDDGPFLLPALNEVFHDVEPLSSATGCLFTVPAIRLDHQREEKKRTIGERCERVASLVNDTNESALVWCQLNDEGDLLQSLIPDSIQVSGHNSDSVKEARFEAFSSGNSRVLITKPQIGAWGMNWQHCSHITYFPSHSFEQYYQAVRRCWRFGQTRTVTVDIIATEGEKRVMENLRRKANAASIMYDNLVAEMVNARDVRSISTFNLQEEIPKWL